MFKFYLQIHLYCGQVDIMIIKSGYHIQDAAEREPCRSNSNGFHSISKSRTWIWPGASCPATPAPGEWVLQLLPLERIPLLVRGWSLFLLKDGDKMLCSSQQPFVCQLITAFANKYVQWKIFMLFTAARTTELSGGFVIFISEVAQQDQK